MRLFIPRYGQHLELTKDWEFALYYEHRNATLLEKHGVDLHKLAWEDCYEAQAPGATACERKLKSMQVTLPAGTVLQVDRIYIRQHDGLASDFDSMSFRVVGSGKGAFGKAKVRFWAKLDECNNIECEVAGAPKTKSSAKKNPNVTADIQVGDVVRYDYVACREECPGNHVTHAECKKSMLVLGKNENGSYHKVLWSDGQDGWSPAGNVYVVEARGVDVKEWVFQHHETRYWTRNWSDAKRSEGRPLTDKWVDAVLAGDEVAERRAGNAMDEWYYRTDRDERLRRENKARRGL